ncbi:MAG: sugar phosphate isomerase/epimerase family protein [Planctomycetota bacterium]
MPHTPLPLGLSLQFFKGYEPGFDLDVHPAMLARHGFRAVEVPPIESPLLADEASLRHVRSAFDGVGVRIWSVHAPFGPEVDLSSPDAAVRDRALSRILASLEKLRVLGGRCLIVHPSAEPIEDAERGARLARSIESIRHLADEVSPEEEAVLALEILPRSCLAHDSAEMLELIEPFDPRVVGICLDVNHANLREDIVAATRRLGPRLVTTHVSDNDGVDERHWLPGQGVIPWQAWVAALANAGYGGPLVYEFSCPKISDPPGPMEDMLAALAANAAELLRPQ